MFVDLPQCLNLEEEFVTGVCHSPSIVMDLVHIFQVHLVLSIGTYQVFELDRVQLIADNEF